MRRNIIIYDTFISWISPHYNTTFRDTVDVSSDIWIHYTYLLLLYKLTNITPLLYYLEINKFPYATILHAWKYKDRALEKTVTDAFVTHHNANFIIIDHSDLNLVILQSLKLIIQFVAFRLTLNMRRKTCS